MKINEIVSRMRNLIKASRHDAFVTDRFLYSLLRKHLSPLVRRQDSTNKLLKFNGIWKPLPYVELIDVDKVEACCTGIRSNCIIKRTKDRLPELWEGYWGPLIRNVASLDYSREFTPTTAPDFTRIANQNTYKYNKTLYYWYSDGYLYFPNIEFDAVRLDVIPDSDVSKYNCEPDERCEPMQEKELHVPEFLLREGEQFVFQELGIMVQLPSDTQQDNKNIAR